VENRHPLPAGASGFEQSRKAPVTRQRAIVRWRAGSGERRFLGAYGQTVILLSHLHACRRARGIDNATRSTSGVDHLAQHDIIAT
jgi:hypothetical protein